MSEFEDVKVAEAALPTRQRCAGEGPRPILVNPHGGTVQKLGADEAGRRIVEAFARHGVAVEPVLARGRRLTEIAAGHVGAEDASPLIVAGGDGSISAVAQVLVGTGRPFGILPLGTRNHFARDLGLPMDLADAVAVIARGVTERVDVGEINGRIFINNASIGLYPELVEARRQHLAFLPKWLASALALLAALYRMPLRRIVIAGDGRIAERRTPIVFIGNNVYGLDFLSLGRRASLTGGTLCLFLASRERPLALFRLALAAALGRLDEADGFERHSLAEVVIRSRRHHLRVALDGEVERLQTPLRCRILPRALRVFVPAAGGAP